MINIAKLPVVFICIYISNVIMSIVTFTRMLKEDQF